MKDIIYSFLNTIVCYSLSCERHIPFTPKVTIFSTQRLTDSKIVFCRNTVFL